MTIKKINQMLSEIQSADFCVCHGITEEEIACDREGVFKITPELLFSQLKKKMEYPPKAVWLIGNQANESNTRLFQDKDRIAVTNTRQYAKVGSTIGECCFAKFSDIPLCMNNKGDLYIYGQYTDYKVIDTTSSDACEEESC